VLAERLRRNSLNPVVVYCSQTLNPTVSCNYTEDSAIDSNTYNNSSPSLAASSNKKLICAVVSKLLERRLGYENFLGITDIVRTLNT
jgi:hypothetical protein